ncbi:MAG: hypothetical protein LBB83_11400, partial [Treponema sp.]|nr:hypothetical protein [Treponema sp.]
DGNTLFSKEFSPAETKSVSNQPVSGIVLDAGDISVGRMSWTVTFINMPSPAPYRITLNANYGYSDNSSGKYINNGSSASVTLNGSAGTWSIPRDDDFLAALESGDQKVQFYLNITLNQGENSNSLPPIEKTVGKNGIGAVDLGSVAIPRYIKLSGTFTGTYNGGTLPRVYLYPCTQDGQNLGSSVSLSTPAAGASWTTYIPALDSPTKVVFSVSAYSDSGSTLFNGTVSPSQTQAVSSQPVSGIVINIGDIKPDTLSVANPPQGSYTVYITDTYIRDNNYASVSSSSKATGTGSGSSVTLTWDSSADKAYRYYHVLISAGSVTKYGNNVLFVNGTGSVDWNDMTEVSGSGDGTGSGTGETLTPDIDSALVGTWVDQVNGQTFTATFTNSAITWGGTYGSATNTATNMYQGSGYTAVWIAKNGEISLKYTYMGVTSSYKVYDYVINSQGQLEFKTSGTTIMTLVKQ